MHIDLRKTQIIGVLEWMMILPAMVFLTAAAVRLLQPRQFEPSRTSWIIFDWTTTHISNIGASLLFDVLPAATVAIGAAALVTAWRSDAAFRSDAAAALAIVRRQRSVLLLVVATLIASAILAFAVAHAITD